MPNNANDWVSIGSKALAAQINPLGAQLSVLRDRNGCDLLWDGDPAVWTGRAPVLFPIVGELAGGVYRLDGKSYALPRHGFARGKRFEVVETTAVSATFRLKTDEATLALYPFEFELDLRFDISGSTLAVTAFVRNLGRGGMPASLGFHPALRWPLSPSFRKDNHFIAFEADELAPVRRLDTAGLLSPARHATPIRHRRLALRDELFRNDALILDQVRSRTVTYGAENGPRIRVDFPDTPYLGLWSKSNAHFVCIEPWHGIADPEDFTGDFRDKPGVFSVEPGTTKEITMDLTLIEA